MSLSFRDWGLTRVQTSGVHVTSQHTLVLSRLLRETLKDGGTTMAVKISLTQMDVSMFSLVVVV